MYEKFSTQYSSDGKLAFAKVNVDDQNEIAAKYGIQAMPTFLVLKGDEVVETIKGANPPALKKAVEMCVEKTKNAEPAVAPEEGREGEEGTEELSMAERLGIKLG